MTLPKHLMGLLCILMLMVVMYKAQLLEDTTKFGCVNVGGTPEHVNVSNNIMAGGARSGQLAIRVDSGAQDVVFGGNSLSQFESATPWNDTPELFVYGQRGI